MKTYLLLIVAILCGSCTGEVGEHGAGARWYSTAQVESGRLVFTKNCAVCHKSDASGTPDWKKRLDDGFFPPPPLNGTAHAWHHSISVLKEYIADGGASMGGRMPGFKDKLRESEMLDAIAYFQSYWSDDVYGMWKERNGLDIGENEAR